MKQKVTQVSRLIAYLRAHKRGITTLEAAKYLGICSLHRRISDAAQRGAVIHGMRQSGSRHYRYRLFSLKTK